MTKKRNDKEIAREGISSEIDAINLYERLAEETKDPRVKKVLLDIAKEEKTHVGEFQSVLMREDPEQKTAIDKGKNEVKNLEKADAFSKNNKKRRR